ncbi:MAG: hypothetical protein ABMA26_03640 [Limisphaerales bacterium]
MFNDLGAEDDVEGFGAQKFEQVIRGRRNFKAALWESFSSQFNSALAQVHAHDLAAQLSKLATVKSVAATHVQHPRPGADRAAQLQHFGHEVPVHMGCVLIVKFEFEIGFSGHIS